MHNTETVRDEHVSQSGQFLSESFALSVVLGGLSSVETYVLQQHDLAGLSFGHSSLSAFAYSVASQGYLNASQLL